jgi:gliding motility-associated protein GldM
MSVKNCPETPRQRMISLMYLVLTAMLALNVDKSVIDAFALVNQGFTQTIENFNKKNQNVYTRFYNAAQENKQKAGALNDKVIEIKRQTDSLYNDITHYKEMIVKKADGPQGNIDDIVAKEDMQYAEEVMITHKNGPLLKKAIEDYRKFLLSNIDPGETSLIASIEKSLDTSDPPGKEGSKPTWESSKFAGYPLIAVVTLMSKMQSDIRNSESDIINYLYSKIDAASFKFNKLEAKVIQKSSYILVGNTYEANVFLSAVDTTAQPEVIVNGQRVDKGIYKAAATKEGPVTWKGVINYKNPSGIIVPYPFEQSYEVAKPSSTISPTKMNVLYVSLPNPISISVPGFSSRDIQAEMTNGRIERAGDTFLAYPTKAGVPAVITVKVNVDKVVKEMGSMPFRVKDTPKPIASVAGKSDGLITKSELTAEQGVFAEIPEFDFDLKYTVLSFSVAATVGSFVSDLRATGNRFTQEQKDLFKQLNRGNRFVIENIVAKGENGVTKNLAPLSFKIQ